MSLSGGIMTIDLGSYQTGLTLSIYEDAPLSEISQEDVERYNESMERASTVRLQPVVEGEGEESKKAAKAAKTSTEE